MEHIKERFTKVIDTVKSNNKYKIYYVIILIFIIVGFIVGNKSYSLDGGYIAFYGTSYNHYIGEISMGKGTDNVEIGDRTDYKYTGFYNLIFTSKKTYFDNEKELSLDEVADMASVKAPIKYCYEIKMDVLNNAKEFKKQIYWWNITITILLIIVLAIAPFILPKITSKIKSIKKNKSDKIKLKQEEKQVKNNFSNIQELKEYKELLDNGIITQEEFNQKKKQLLNL